MDSRNTLEEELGLPEHPFESIVTEEAYRKVGVYANLRLAGLEARQFLEGQGSDNAVEKISQYLENIQLLKKGILHTAPDEYNALDALVSAIENLKESNPGHHVRKLPREGSKLHLFRNRHRAGANKKTLAA